MLLPTTTIDLARVYPWTGRHTFADGFGVRDAVFSSEFDNGNSGVADTIDWTAGNKQKSTLTGDCTFVFAAPLGPCNLVLKLVQDGVGTRLVTWPGTVLWAGGVAPTISVAIGAVDIVTFYFDGADYYGAGGLAFA